MPSTNTYDYDCLMVNFDIPWWNKFTKGIIPEEYVYTEEEGFGIEDLPHITVLYGLHNGTDVEKLQKLLPGINTISCDITNISSFKNDKYDVLKFDIYSPSLYQCNDMITKNFEYTTDFPIYHPHMTIAYLKPGKAVEVLSKLSKPYTELVNIKPNKNLIPSKYSYSFSNGDKIWFT